ncbi:MAG: hypothetical protein WCF93_04575 [Candidatus Moraniibacteriota bacterium]
MKKKLEKILAGTMLSTIMLVVSGFCNLSMAQASLPKMDRMTEIADAHCESGNHVVNKNAPVSGAMMPCCVEKHDNSAVFTPVAPNEKIKFEQVSIAEQSVLLAQTINQKTYASSSSPPEPDSFSSSIRLE